MGVQMNITHNKFPEQGNLLGKHVKVFFHYDTTRCAMGKVIRNDLEHPRLTIIQLSDGRVVLATECQFSPNVKPGDVPS